MSPLPVPNRAKFLEALKTTNCITQWIKSAVLIWKFKNDQVCSYQTLCCSEKNDEKENTFYKNFPARASLLAEAYNVIGSQLSRGLPCHYALPPQYTVATTIPSLPCESEYIVCNRGWSIRPKYFSNWSFGVACFLTKKYIWNIG